jgi:hypothetical protein
MVVLGMRSGLKTPLRRALVIAITLVLAVAYGDPGQSGTYTVSGVATDKRGNFLPKTVVHLKSLGSLEIETYIIQEGGEWHFNGLNPNVDYEVHAEYRGKASRTVSLSRFDSNKHAPIKLVIPVE